MRAAQLSELKQPPRLVELDDVDGIHVEAVALNPLDIAVGSGVFYGGHPELPYVPGCEAAGRRADGARVYLFGDGRGVSKPGFLAERVGVPDDLPLAVPAGTDPALAAVAGVAGIAGWVPVAWKAKVGPGDRVLVLGARGAVGQVAIQAARLLGAEKVVGAGRRATGEIVALDDVGDAFGEEGFTVCIDPLWGEPLARVLAHAARHARVVHVGQTAGPEAPLRSADVRGKELVIMGHSNFVLSREERDRAYLEVLERLASGDIALHIERYPLDRAAEAWERQRSGPGGKVVIEL
jgi:NADPH:quinone reductase-like Zn-dependent oxidoreductase